jgi:hypothetical protein
MARVLRVGAGTGADGGEAATQQSSAICAIS